MTIHIGYDREEDKIELILPSQGNVISTLKDVDTYHITGLIVNDRADQKCGLVNINCYHIMDSLSL